MKIKIKNQLYSLNIDRTNSGLSVSVKSPASENFILVKPDELPRLISYLQAELDEFNRDSHS